MTTLLDGNASPNSGAGSSGDSGNGSGGGPNPYTAAGGQPAGATGATGATGPAEGATGDAGDQGGQGAQGAPEQYADFTLPEGVTLSDEQKAGITGFAKELNLTQEQAQKLVDREVAAQANAAQAEAERTKQIVQEWTDATKADPEIGGEKLNESLAVAKKGLEQFASTELRQMLNASGLGNHPTVIKHFQNLGKLIAEDRFVAAPNGGAAKPSSIANRLYPNLQ